MKPITASMKPVVGKVFDALPGCYLLLDPEEGYTILAATDAYLEVTGKDRSIIGRRLFDVFPGNPDDRDGTGVRNLTHSLEEVVRTGAPHEMAVQRYDTRSGDSGPFTLHFWKPLNLPVHDEEGTVKYIIHSVLDVTRQTILGKQLRTRDEYTQQQIADAVTTTQEMERLEIGRELHDNVNQLLITARLYIGRSLDKQPVDKELAQAGLELLEKAVGEIKSLTRALVNTSFEEENLVQALEDLVQQVLAHTHINITREIQLPDESLIESKAKLALLRIVQEQVANVLRHSEAKNLFVGISFKDDRLELTIRDDGKGFVLSETKGGMGFQNMKSRVALMDGTLVINSAPGDGCTIEVHIPMSEKQGSSTRSGQAQV